MPVITDTCLSSFSNCLTADFTSKDCDTFQDRLEDEIPFNPELHDKVAIDTCAEKLSGAILENLAVFTPKGRPRDDTRPPMAPRIQDEIRPKNRLMRQRHITMDPSLNADVNRLQRSVNRQLNEWRNNQCRATLPSRDPEDQSL